MEDTLNVGLLERKQFESLEALVQPTDKDAMPAARLQLIKIGQMCKAFSQSPSSYLFYGASPAFKMAVDNLVFDIMTEEKEYREGRDRYN